MSLPFHIDINYENIKTIDPKELKIRKKLNIYELDSKYILLHIEQKSRVLQKDVEKIEEILNKIQEFTNTTYENKLLKIDAPLCSKAKTKFESINWTII